MDTNKVTRKGKRVTAALVGVVANKLIKPIFIVVDNLPPAGRHQQMCESAI